ncbi:MAG: GNAT family N-acetyltransferase [Paracoccaceae bacterium]
MQGRLRLPGGFGPVYPARMTPCAPTPADAEAIARLHVQAWAESYAGLLPAAEIARYDLPRRVAQWRGTLEAGVSRASWVPGAGFASAGVQRDAGLLAAGYPEEVYAIYLLASAQRRRLGWALLRAVVTGQPFSTLVIEGNDQACRFYERSGGRWMATRDDRIGETPIRERVYVWDHGLPAKVS